MPAEWRVTRKTYFRQHADREQSYSDEAQKLSYPRWFAFGVGHVLNDLCASMWFTYVLVFYHFVIQLPNSIAGTLILIGQVADALSTPFCGYECDRTRCRYYGRRKTWHLIGTSCVAASVFFIYHDCITCEDVDVPYKILYFSCFIIVFQFGWAATQISHLSLIPDLTQNKSVRVGLNSIRYFFTIMSNLSVFAAMWLLLQFVGQGVQTITPDDKLIFWAMGAGIIGVGLIFSAIFHIGVREPPLRDQSQQVVAATATCRTEKPIKWYQWFKNPQFYMVAVLYMCTRLIVNLTQLYSPFFVLESLNLAKTSVATAPFVIFLSSLVVTLVQKYINKLLGRNMTFFVGLAVTWAGLIWCWVQPPSMVSESDFGDAPGISSTVGNAVYGALILLGMGGTTLLITALSLISDLIGDMKSSSAFVYGIMSFTDKLSNGIAIQVIQLLHPCKGSGSNVCCEACQPFYREVLVYVPGGATMLALAALAVLVLWTALARRRTTAKRPLLLNGSQASSSPSIQQSDGKVGSANKPCECEGECMCSQVSATDSIKSCDSETSPLLAEKGSKS